MPPVYEGEEFEKVALETPHNLNEVAKCLEFLPQTRASKARLYARSGG
jgi:hypothetical protein